MAKAVSSFVRALLEELANFRTFAAALLAGWALVHVALAGVKGEDLMAVRWGLVLLVLIVAGRSVGHAWATGRGGGIASVLQATLGVGGAAPAKASAPPDAGFAPVYVLLAIVVMALVGIAIAASPFWGLLLLAVLAGSACLLVAALAFLDPEGRSARLAVALGLAGLVLVGGGVLTAIGRGLWLVLR